MANRVDIVVKNQNNIKGPLTINLDLPNDQTPVKVTLDGKTSSLSPHKPFKLKLYDRAIVITVIILSLIILIGGISTIANILINHSVSATEFSRFSSNVSNSEETKNVFRFASRDEWLARPASEELDNLELPVHRVIIAHTATSNCSNQASCSSTIYLIQNYHMDSRNFKDIGYNFLVGGDGTVYEGRGWNAVGAHTKGFNVDSICIAFIGTFNTHAPLEKQLNAGKWIIGEGVRLNKLVKDYRLYGANQLMGTMFKTDTKVVDMENRVFIYINNNDIKAPIIINLHLPNGQTPVEVTLDGKTTSLSPHKPFNFKSYDKAIVIIVIIISLLVLIGGIFATANFLINHSGPPTEFSTLSSTVSNSETKYVLRIASRDEWLARPASEELDNLELPVHRVIIAHTATSNCSNQASCSSTIYLIQNYHMDSRNFKDIGYNVLVGGDGTVYEGRGWNAVGAHTKGFNVDSICIAFIGTFNTHAPLEKQLNAGKWIIGEGVRLNKLVKDYRLYGSNQLIETASPGSALYEIIKHWQNWSNNTT